MIAWNTSTRQIRRRFYQKSHLLFRKHWLW